MIYGINDFGGMMRDVKKVYDIPEGMRLNIKWIGFCNGVGRWHIQVREGVEDGLGTPYDKGTGEWWTIEMWLDNPIEPVLLG